MQLELIASPLIPNAWEMEVEVVTYPQSYFKVNYHPGPDWRDDFMVFLDRTFIFPFDFRRISPWRRVRTKQKTYWTYLTLPEGWEWRVTAGPQHKTNSS